MDYSHLYTEAEKSEDYGTIDHMGMGATGAMLTGAMVMGLKSFDGTEELFGQLGKTLGDPQRAVMNMLGRMNEAYKRGGETGTDSARRRLIDAAVGEDKTEIQKLAERLSKSESMTRELTESLTRARREIQLGEAKESIESRAKRASSSMQESVDRMNLDAFKEAIRDTLSDSRHPIWRSIDDVDGPMTETAKQVRNVIASTDDPVELANQVLERQGSQQRFAQGEIQGSRDAVMRLFHANPQQVLHELDLGTVDRGALKRLYSAAKAARGPNGRPLPLNGTPEYETAMRRAWRQYAFENPSRAYDPSLSIDEIAERMEEDEDLARLFERQVRGAQGVKSRFRRTNSGNFAPAQRFNYLAATHLAPDTAKKLAIERLGSTDIKGIFDDSVVENMTERLNQELQVMADDLSQQGRQVRAEVQMKAVGQSRVAEFTFSEGGETVRERIPIRSSNGQYQMTEMGRPFNAGLTLSFEEELTQQTGRQLIRPEEKVMNDLFEYVSKIKNDFLDNRGPTAAAGLVNQQYRRHFKSKDYAGDAPLDNLRHAMNVHIGEMVVMEDIKNNRRRFEQMENRVEHVDRLKRLVAGRGRFFAADLEFWSAEQSRGSGAQKMAASRGELPYQISGTIMEAGPNGSNPMASIDYKAQLFEELSKGERRKLFGKFKTQSQRDAMVERLDAMQEGRGTRAALSFQEEVLAGIHKFQRRHMKDPEDLNKLFQDLERGQLTIRAGGATMSYDMQKGFVTNGGENKAFDLVRDMQWEGSESFEKFSLRVMNQLNEGMGTQYSAGHNFEMADAPILQRLYRQNEMGTPSIFQNENVVDTYQAARGLHTEGGMSFGQESLIARKFGLSKSELDRVMQAIDQGNIRALSGKKRQAAESLAAEFDRAGIAGSAHSADVDSVLTGGTLVPELYGQATSPEGEERLARARDMMKATRRATGPVTFASQNYGHLYGHRSMGDDANQLSFAFATQQGVAEGQGSLLNISMLPFHQLLNPERQRYQDIKAKKLFYDNVVQDTKSSTPVLGSAAFGTAGMGGRVSSNMYAGYSQHTKRFFDAMGDMQEQMGVQAKIAYLPEQLSEVWESQAVMSQSAVERMSGPKAVKSMKLDLDYERLRRSITQKGKDGRTPLQRVVERDKDAYFGASREERMERMPDGRSRLAARMEIYKEIAMLEEASREAQGAGKKAIDAALREARMRLDGVDNFQDVMMKDAYDAARRSDPEKTIQSNEVVATGETDASGNPKQSGDTVLFEEGELGYSKGTVRSPNKSVVAPLTIQFDHESRSVHLRYLEDPKSQMKVTAGPTRDFKGTINSVTPGNEVLQGTGIQAKLGAMFWKSKRKEVGNLVQIQIGRVLTAANDQIRLMMSQGGVPAEEAADRAKKVIRDALRELGVTSPAKIDKAIKVETKYGEPRLRIEYTDDIMNTIREKGSTLRFMNMTKRAGLTFKHVHQRASAFMEGATDLSAAAKKRLHGEITETMERQVKSEIEGFEKALRQMDAAGGGTAEKAQMQDVLNRYKKALKQGVAQSDEGFLFDVIAHTDKPGEDDMNVSSAFIVDRALQNIEHSVYSNTSMEQVFASGTGRITKKKRMSTLDSALLSRSISERALGGLQDPMRALTDSWLASNAGMVKISDKRLRTEVVEALHKLKRQNKKFANMSVNELARHVKLQGQGYKLVWHGESYDLDLNPYALRTSTTRAHLSLVASITGEMPSDQTAISGVDLGSSDRVFNVTEDTLERALLGLSPEDRKEARRAVTGNKVAESSAVYMGQVGEGGPESLHKKGMLASAADNPLFDRGVDLVGFEVFDEDAVGPMTRKNAANLLRQAGASEMDVQMVLGRDGLTERALLADFEGIDADVDDIGDEGKALSRRVEQMRGAYGSDEMTLGSKFYVPGLSESAVWMREGDHMRVHLPAQLRTIYDNAASGKLSQAASFTTEILRAAKENPSKVTEMLAQNDVRDALQARERSQISAVQASAISAIREFELESGRFIEGAYKTATGRAKHVERMQALSDAYDDPDRFRGMVQEMYLAEKNTGLRAGDTVPDALAKEIDRASKGLREFIGNQQYERGGRMREAYKFKGFGLNETVVGDTVGRRVASQMNSYKQLLDAGGLDIDDQLMKELERMGMNDLSAEAMQEEIRLANQAVEQPGKASVMTLEGRQPNFQNILPAQVTSAYVLPDEAMVAMGADPEETIGGVNPLRTPMHRGDYDGDALWRSSVGMPALSSALRRQMAPDQGDQVLDVYKGMLGMEGSTMDEEMRAAGLGGVENVDGRNVVRPGPSDPVFEGSQFAKRFGFEGQADAAFMGDELSRESLATQKTVVGAFGSYQKRSVLFAQFENEFGGLAKQMTSTPQAFTGAEIESAERIAGTMNSVRGQSSGIMRGGFQNLALAEAFVTQDAAIEKHKGSGAVRGAEDVLRVMDGLFSRNGKKTDRAIQEVMGRVESAMADSDSDDIFRYYGNAFGGDLDALETSLRGRSEAYRFTEQISRRTGRTSGYLGNYTSAETAEQTLDTQAPMREANVFMDGPQQAMGGAEAAIQSHARAASSLMNEIQGMTMNTAQMTSQGGRVSGMLSSLPQGAKIGGAIGGAGMLLLSLGRDNIAGEMGPSGPQDVAGNSRGEQKYQAHTRQSTRRLIASRERAQAQLSAAGVQQRDIGRQFVVPPPPGQTRSY